MGGQEVDIPKGTQVICFFDSTGQMLSKFMPKDHTIESKFLQQIEYTHKENARSPKKVSKLKSQKIKKVKVKKESSFF